MTSFHERAPQLIAQAEPFYNPELPYHNWNHAVEVMEASGRWLEQSPVLRNDTELADFLLVAAAWHDAGHDHTIPKKFASKEAYSVHLMQEALGSQISEDEFEELEEAILGTRFNTERESDIALLLHYADIDNIGHEYDDFYAHNMLLWEERGRPEWATWTADNTKVIRQLAHEASMELPLIGGSLVFARNMLKNVRQLHQEQGPKL